MSLKHTIIASMIMIATMLFLEFISRVEDIHVNKPLSSFPKIIGNLQGQEQFFEKQIYEKVGVDDSFLCQYTAPNEIPIQLYIGYYRSQKEGDLIHSPKHCMPGEGWKIARVSSVELNQVMKNGQKQKVAQLIITKNSQKMVVLYWFHSRGRIIASEYLEKIYLVIDSVFRNRTDGSFIRLIAPVVDNNEAETTKALIRFSEITIPILNSYIPS